MLKYKSKHIFMLIAALGLALLGTAYYLQLVQHLNPCPLCIAQRLVFIGITLIAILGIIISKPILSKLLALVTTSLCLLGVGIAGRQVWLQHLPEDAKPSCGPGLDYLLNNFPLLDVLKNVLRGSGDCAKVDWTFLHLSIAQWSLAWFVILLVLSVVALTKNARI